MSNQDLIRQVKGIADNLTDGITYENAGIENEYGADADEIVSGIDYIFDALDIEYRVSNQTGGAGRWDYLGAHILIAFGGPNIWINTRNNTVEGHWWGDSFTATYIDTMDISGAAEELFLSRSA